MTATTFLPQDYEYMALAIRLAARGQFTTTPNPNVGCVVVQDGNIIGQGWHQKAGSGHAEVNALANLPLDKTRGATVYVTLEPCSHHGRTAPCADLLVSKQVARVCIAMLDPNPLVAGNGVKKLQAANIKVQSGLLEADARALNPGFLTRMEQKRPFIQVKLASSIDGKTALSNGESKWITGPQARADVQGYRAKSCAILTSAKTVLRDNARLNVRHNELTDKTLAGVAPAEIRQPIKIVLDGQHRITSDLVEELALFDGDTKVIVVRAAATSEFEGYKHVHVVVANYTESQGFDLPAIISWCADQEINRLWVEAGGQLAASFIEQELYDQLILYVAPKILGKDAMDLFPIGPFANMADIYPLHLLSHTMVGQDVKYVFNHTNQQK